MCEVLQLQDYLKKLTIMLKTVLICIIILKCSYSNTTQATPSCPMRPISDMRGPPGIPGKKGESGIGKFSKTINKKLSLPFAYSSIKTKSSF